MHYNIDTAYRYELFFTTLSSGLTSIMYYNRSCRACGTHLEPSSVCNVCKEYVCWICSKCFKADDVIHRHNYCIIPRMAGVVP